MKDYKYDTKRSLIYMIWFCGIHFSFHINTNGMFYIAFIVQTYSKGEENVL